ncbi:MAG: hypothetical protein HYU69_02905 [Bacteroidetes bacterium]|nr:hypothetical protein [Bacteroidota bacterium]
MLLKTIDKPLGRYAFKKRTDGSANEGNAGWWALGLYSLFHGSGYSSHDGHSGHDSGGYDSHRVHDYGEGADSTGYDGGDGGH